MARSGSRWGDLAIISSGGGLAGGRELDLTAREFDLLLQFARLPGGVIAGAVARPGLGLRPRRLRAHGELAYQPAARQARGGSAGPRAFSRFGGSAIASWPVNRVRRTHPPGPGRALVRRRILLVALAIGLAVAGVELLGDGAPAPGVSARGVADPQSGSGGAHRRGQTRLPGARRSTGRLAPRRAVPLADDREPHSGVLPARAHGEVLGWRDRGGETLAVATVDLDPILRALAGAVPPVLGRDPRIGREKVFSAAPLLAADGSTLIGYLYVILESTLFDRVDQAVAESSMLRRLAWLAAFALSGTLALGAAASWYVTGPLRRLRDRVGRVDLARSRPARIHRGARSGPPGCRETRSACSRRRSTISKGGSRSRFDSERRWRRIVSS